MDFQELEAKVSKIFQAPRLPEWIQVSKAAHDELHEICHLVLGVEPNLHAGVHLVATSIACRQLAFDPAFKNELTGLLSCELEPDFESLDDDERAILHEQTNSIATRAIEWAVSPLGAAQTSAERLKSVPPLARCIVSEYVRSLSRGTLCLEPYRDYRTQGGDANSNEPYIDWLGFFRMPDDTTRLPSTVTKAVLFQALEQHGVKCKTSMSREAMIEAARQKPGLLTQLILQSCPQRRDLLPQWRESVLTWSQRVEGMKLLAAALLKLLALSTIKASENQILRNLPLKLVLKTVSQIRCGAERFVSDQTNLKCYPAWELSREFDREVPRGFRKNAVGELVPVPGQDWPSRWRAAAVASGDTAALRVLNEDGRMVALKSSRIWQALGDGAGGYMDALGYPFAPFAFDSGFDTSGVDVSKCAELGLIAI